MSNDQLKALVIEKILYEQNETTLQNILNLLVVDHPPTVSVTPAQRAAIEEGLADYHAGRFSTQEELNEEEKGWL